MITKVTPIVLLAITFSIVSQNLENNSFNNAVNVQATANTDNFADYTYSGSYYDSITATDEGLSSNLRKQLSAKIVPAAYPTYGGSSSSNALAYLLQEADEDPTNSSNMIYFYTRDSVKKNAASSWNREHVWPQSLSGSNWGTTKGGADLLHIRPTYNSTNEKRGNLKYGDLNKSGTTLTYNNMSYGWSSGNYFEPLDSVKGDAARIIMYMYVAYQNVYTSMVNITNVFESYDTLLNWHINDTPDLLEGNRNNYAESSIQKNRNPFVDHPEYACKIFGSSASNSVREACFNKYGSEITYDDLESLSMSETSLSLEEGKTKTLSVSPTPSTASSSVTWSSSDKSVATISSSGLVTAVSEGSTTITATSTVDSSIKATCLVTVLKKEESTTVSNSIKDCYDKTLAKNESRAVSNVYGIYVGTGDGSSPIIMNGEYGITLYGYSINESWVKNETVLKITNGTLTNYNGLYEIKKPSITIITNEEEIANNVSPIITYSMTGSETSNNTSLASRLTLVSGTIASANESNKDYQATITLANSKTVNLFVKSTYKTGLQNIIVTGASLTLKGFTSIYGSSFQVQVFENVKVSDDYTAENFASDLLDKTNTICSSSTNKKNDLSPVWIDLEQNYYSKLSEIEKTTLINSGASYQEGTTIEQAMDRYDYIVSHYGLNNFINRTITKVDFNLTQAKISNNTLLIVIIISFFSISAISIAVLTSKKKTTNKNY